MIIIDEIKSLPAKEKVLIFSALQDDIDVLGEFSNINRVDENENASDLSWIIDEEKILKYIQMVDDRVAMVLLRFFQWRKY